MTYNPPISFDTISSLNPYDSTVSVVSLIDFHAAALIKFIPQQKFFRTSTCFIPPDKIFCFGNIEGAMYTGKTVLIEGDKAKVMKSGKACMNSGLVYLKGYVYVFGGNTNEGLSLCEKFSILRNQWSKLPKLEASITNCVCIDFCGNILYAGNSKSVYLYDVYLNSHLLVFQCATYNKLICHWDERAYLIECEGKIHESDKRNPFKWSQISSSTTIKFINYNYTGINIFFVDSWYFKFRNGEIYIFDLEEKKLVKKYLNELE